MTFANIIATLTRLVVPLSVLLLIYAVDQRAEQRGMQKAKTQQSAATIQRLEYAIERSGQLAGQIDRILESNQQDKAHAQQTLDRLDADLRSGTLRLSIRTAERPPSPSSHSPAAGPEQTRADIDPADAAALVRITSAGDDSIIDLNTCIDAYGKVMLQANGAQQDRTPP